MIVQVENRLCLFLGSLDSGDFCSNFALESSGFCSSLDLTSGDFVDSSLDLRFGDFCSSLDLNSDDFDSSLLFLSASVFSIFRSAIVTSLL